MFERTWAGIDTPDLTVSAIIALEEVTAEMGATRLVLGSNRDGGPGASHEGNASKPPREAEGDGEAAPRTAENSDPGEAQPALWLMLSSQL
jgi:hypothetical protein